MPQPIDRSHEEPIPTAEAVDPPSVSPSCDERPEEIITALAVEDATDPLDETARRESLERLGFFQTIGSVAEWLFGAATMIVILAILATIPILQFLSLGYLLEAAGRVARSGRIRDGFIGIRKAARIGSIVLGTWILLLPLRLVSDLWADARLIDPASGTTRGWAIAVTILTVVLVPHIIWAWYRGGRFRHFLGPAPVRFCKRVVRGGMLVEARDGVWDFVTELRLPYYAFLGFRGFAGALVWLFVPVTMLAIATQLPSGLGVLVGLLGGLLLATVVLYLPFAQTHFAVENRFRAIFELRAVRRLFRRAPIAFWFALLITLASALPLYLLKIELTPREVAWLPSLIFVVFIFPARILTGWAVGRGLRRDEPRHFIFRWSARLAALPIAATYALIVYFTQYLSWYGAYSLYEQHAFLLPVPFLGM